MKKNNLDYLEECLIKLKFVFPDYTLWIETKIEWEL